MAKAVIGAIGAGQISRFHFRAFKETETKVRIIADVNRQAAQPYLDTFGAEYTNDPRQVVSHPEVNTVVIMAPSRLHYELAKAALENGKHVICEKTLTLSAAQSLELGRLAQQKKLILFTSYMKRFFPAAQKAKALMPKLGHIMSVYCRTYQGVGGFNMHTGEVNPFFAPGPDGVSGIKKLSGGGILVCGGSHVVDLMMFLVGKPLTVYGRRFQRQGCDVDFMTHAVMDLPGGGVAHFEANWHPLNKIGYERRGWDEVYEINGVNGRLIIQTPVWDMPENNAATLSHYDNETETWTEYDLNPVNPFVEAEKYFLGRIAAGSQGPEHDCFVGYRTDLLLEQIEKSALENRPLTVAWQD